MARAAMRLKCRRGAAAKLGELASFNQTSLTRAVGLSVALGSPRLTHDASLRNSSYVRLKRSSSARRCSPLRDVGGSNSAESSRPAGSTFCDIFNFRARLRPCGGGLSGGQLGLTLEYALPIRRRGMLSPRTLAHNSFLPVGGQVLQKKINRDVFAQCLAQCGVEATIQSCRTVRPSPQKFER